MTELVRGGREAMKKEDHGRCRRAGRAVENGESVCDNCVYSDTGHDGTSGE